MFADREDAARQLAREFSNVELTHPLVLAIPRGGVATGAVLADELGAELDVVLSRKLRAPMQPELAIGAVGEDGEVYLNHAIQFAIGVDESYIDNEREHQMREIARRQELFRAVRPQAQIGGRSVIITDDGIATGSTMIAALHAVRAQKPREMIVAVPVAPRDRLETIRRLCDRVICLLVPNDFMAVGQFYRSFEPVEDSDVVRLLREQLVAGRR
jgi:predicted phosphoribosyltransferase